MEYDGKVVFGIEIDGKPAKASLQDVTAMIQKESKNWDADVKKTTNEMSSSFGSALKSIGVAISAAAIGKKLLDIGKDALQAASDLQEVQNVVDVTFGESASAIESWSKTAGTQFGLTETQAKKFASTLGAMMKSAGMSGNEIVEMSTDLAGLAADMASFYNLDFETAFQKIRSGISGETEPLKQLGINMSVANLEAFALTQGITKAFDKMSQGEQTMLRYQYMMQATADAQGDFARTSDGYANSLRMMETNIESLKTKLGEVLVPAISKVVKDINGMLDMLTPKEGYRTVLDDFAEIDLQTEDKLAKINATAEQAMALSETLGKISQWGSTSGETTLKNAFDTLPDEEKVSAWNELFGAIAGHAQEIIDASSDGDAAEQWLKDMADSANTLDPKNATAWGDLLTALSGGLLSLSETVGGRNILDELTQQYLAMGTQSAAGTAGLMALGYSSEEIANKQEQWLKTCKSLVSTIPSLNEVINTETGEVQGGTDAIKKHVEEWQKAQEKIIMWEAYYAKEKALLNSQTRMNDLQLDVYGAEHAIKKAKEKLDELREKYGFGDDGYTIIHRMNMTGGAAILTAEEKEWNAAVAELSQHLGEYQEATANLTKEQEANAQATEYLQNIHDGLIDKYGEAEEAVKGLDESTKELSETEKNELATSIQAVTDAYNSLVDYIEQANAETRQSLANTVKGFENVLSPADKARQSMKDLTKQMEDMVAQGEDTSALQKTFSALEGSVPSIQSMTAALESQLAFLDRYNEALAAAKARGVSDAVLAALADGSPESLDYLEALGKGAIKDGDIEALNAKYAEVQSKTDSLANSLTETKLAVDDTFSDLVSKAKESVEALNQSAAAADATGATVTAVINVLAEKKAAVDEQVDAINASIARLGSTLPSFSWGGGIFSSIAGLFKIGSHANGLDYVPFDNYLAQLHEGESVLTAEEARVWRQFRYGQMSSRNVDYDALGTTMRDNIKTGGNVYLDGQTVGRVISARQANDYRQLERSGWQS